MGAPKDWVHTFRFHPHICSVCLETGEQLQGLGEPGETSSRLPLPLLPTLSLDNRRDSPGGGGTASSALPGVQNAESAERLLDGVLNENGAPLTFYLEALVVHRPPQGRIPAWAGGGDSGKEACPLGWPRPETWCVPMPRALCPWGCASAGLTTL